MPPPPKVSVLIPTYKYARYLPDAIESVLAQDFGDFEVIISDDASPDQSGDVIRHYAALDPRIKFQVLGKNIGMVPNWNGCLREAKGEYCKFVFGDDCLVSRQALGKMAAMLDAAPGAALAASARLILDEESRPVEVWDDFRQAGTYPGLDVIARCLWQDRNLVGEPSAVMFRRTAATRGFDPALRQVVDLEMWFHLLLAGDLAFDPEPLCGFRRHAGQQTVANRDSHVGPTESLMIADRYLGVLGNRAGLSPFALRYICYRCLYYSRKRAPRLPGILAMESALSARLPAGWRCLLWLLHRCTKPFSNLRRAWGRARERRTPPAAPQLQAGRLRWTPR
jgi:glycosyltransferase involved in cell wall biosynthesis